MRKPLFLLLLLVSVASFLIAGRFLWLRFRPVPSPLPLASSQVASPSGQPYSLQIPDIAVNLRIFPATASGYYWETTSQGVSYLTGTALPGQPGNSVIYGHNWPNLLGRLSDLKLGQTIKVTYANGFFQHFIIQDIKHTAAHDTSIIKPTSDTRLTLYTCTDFFDARRLVITAFPKN